MAINDLADITACLTDFVLFDVFKLSNKKRHMRAVAAQIAFRYRPQDSATGTTRATAKRLAAVLGVGDTQVIYLALHELTANFLL